MAKVCIGVDFGGTFIKFGLLDEAMNPGGMFQLPTPTGQGACAIVGQIVAGIRQLIDQQGLARENIVGIGIGSPGPLSPSRGVIIHMPNVSGMENLPMCELVSKELGIPARLENDANAAALGEFLCGAGGSTHNMILVTLGTGLGGGIICQGKIVHGSHEIAGELGHMIVQPGGRKCGCGQRGCIEQYCSATGITTHAVGQIRAGRASSLSALLEQNGTITARDINQASQARDELAVEIWDELTYFLALGCVNFSRIFDPDKIVFAGGMTKAGDDLLRPVRENYDRLNWQMADDKTEIAIASLGNDAGMIGAAGVAWNSLG